MTLHRSLFLLLLFITLAKSGERRSPDYYVMTYWRDNNELILYCQTSESSSNSTLFRINKTQPIYFTARRVTTTLTNCSGVSSTNDVLSAAPIVLPILPLNIAKFEIKPQYEGTYFCGNPNINIWSVGIGPFTAKPSITKEEEIQTIKTTNGKNVTMVCPVLLGKLEQYYQVQWSGVTNKNNKYIVNKTGNYSSLTIVDIQESECRDYWCRVIVYNPVDGRKWTQEAVFKLQCVSHKYTHNLLLVSFSWYFAAAFLCCLSNCCCIWCRPSSGSDSKKSHPQKCDLSDFVLHKNRCIGSGAFGTVFKAKYKGLTCAAKMLNYHAQCHAAGINAQANVQKEALKHFVKECHFLEDLSHENIVQHITTIDDPTSNFPILVMELMDCSLKCYLEKHRQEVLPLFFQISLFLDISRGLEFLHSKNLIHRDICDDNVLLNVRDNVPKAKLSDFGMSKLIPWDHMSSTMTAVGHRLIYRPPEAATYPIKYTNTLDVYALGVLGLQITLVVVQIRNCNSLLSNLSDDHILKNIIIACLNENGVHRPTSRDVVNMLTSLQ